MAVLLSIFASSLLLNISLGLNIRKQSPRQAPTIGVKVGTNVASLAVSDTVGNHRELRLVGEKSTILYIIKPNCPWCARNLANIRAIAGVIGSKYQFIGISNTTENLVEHLKASPLPFSVFVADYQNLPSGFDPAATPQMILVRPDGIVDKVWRGALTEHNQREVEDFFHIKLPGLLPPAA